MFAVIETGGKQYTVAPGDRLRVEKLPLKEGESFAFDKVLLTADDAGVRVGTPYVSGASVSAHVVAVGREKKKIVFRYHAKTRYRKKKGHRQHYTEAHIDSIAS